MHRLRIVTALVFIALLLSASGCKPPAAPEMPAPRALTALESGKTHRRTHTVPNIGNMRTAIRIPADYDGSRPVPLVVLLHYGYEGFEPEPYTGADMIDTFEKQLDEFGAIAFAPDVLFSDWRSVYNETGACWLVDCLKETYNIDSDRVVLAGYSMGGEGVWHIGSRRQDLFRAAIPIAAPVAGGDAWRIPIRVIHSGDDEIVSYSAARRHYERLKQNGADIVMRSPGGLSHYEMDRYARVFGQTLKSIEESWLAAANQPNADADTDATLASNTEQP